MAGLLAWAADVVGANETGSDVSDDPSSIPLILTPQQQNYINELNQKATSLTRSIQDLRLRIPPSDISQRLPHLHAHSLASNAALALQLNSHSSTREQAQQREAQLLEENAAYEKEITNCEAKIQEKLQEAEQLQHKLKELDLVEENLKAELQKVEAASSDDQSENSVVEHEKELDTAEEDASLSALLENLENKKKELQLMEEKIQSLEKKWAEVQEKALQQPSPAQREKALDKQLHGMIEQLAAKQGQADTLLNEIHIKQKELEGLNALWRRVENTTSKEATTARNRFARSGSSTGFDTDSDLDSQNNLPYHYGGRTEYRQRLRLLRSSFVLYVFLLHIIVFIRIAFI